MPQSNTAGKDPLDQLKVKIKGACKRTKVVQHSSWNLLSGKAKVVADLAGKIVVGMGYAISSGVPFGVLESAVKELESACKSSKKVDVVQQEQAYSILANFNQCLKLQSKMFTS